MSVRPHARPGNCNGVANTNVKKQSFRGFKCETTFDLHLTCAKNIGIYFGCGGTRFIFCNCTGRIAVISAKNHKRQLRKRQSVTAKREKSQTPKVLTSILTLPNLTYPNLT